MAKAETLKLARYDGSLLTLEIVTDDDPETAGVPWGSDMTRTRARGLAMAPPTIGAARSGLASAEVSFFELDRPTKVKKSRPPGARFRNADSGMISTLYREIVVRTTVSTRSRKLIAMLKSHGMKIKRRNEFVDNQIVVSDPDYTKAGLDLIEISNKLNNADEVEFAAPNFVSEFSRAAVAAAKQQWHLPLVKAPQAWQSTTGKKMIVAVLDDGVQLNHPALRYRLWKNPDSSAQDKRGRDFFVRSDDPEHWDPSVKVAGQPWTDLSKNDFHGTNCAGLVAASGEFPGVAAQAKILPIRVFSGGAMAAEEHVANAIRYAGLHADVLSCSWFGGTPATDLHFALRDIASARDGLGAPAFFAAGNFNRPVEYPARDEGTIAVGAITATKERAFYSNKGDALSLVAPGGDHDKGIFTTDLSATNRGRNPGPPDRDLTSKYTDAFIGTSAATPIAAGAGALVLSQAPDLTAAELKQVLEDTAQKIGPADSYDQHGHSTEFGYGLIDVEAAIEAALDRN